VPENPQASYYRARYYSPQLERFVSEDPARFRGGDVNLYGYVWGSAPNFRDPLGLFGAGFTGGYSSFGGAAVGAGGSVSGGGIVFSDTSSPIGYTSGFFATQGAFVGPNIGNWGTPDDMAGGNYVAGASGGFGAGFIVTNGNSINDLAGPFSNTTISAFGVNIDIGKGANGVVTFGVTAGLGAGFGFAHYCTNTWTYPVSNNSFSNPGTPSPAGRNCRCNTGP